MITHKYLFNTDFGHRNYVYFSMLIIWISGIGYTMEIKHWISYVATFWTVEIEVVGSNPGQVQVYGYSTEQVIQWLAGNLLKLL